MKRSALAFLIFLGTIPSIAQKNYVSFVNPFVGTGGHGHTYPGATLPHGMVQLSPDTRLEGWDGCGGYHYSDSFIYGFTHTHLSGTGVSDFGDILLMPMAGKPSPNNREYGASFDHQHEKASAGYYQVTLKPSGIDVQLTATERVGFHQYHFAGKRTGSLILDLLHRDEVISSSLKIEDSVTVTGMRQSKSWANNQYVFFVMKFSKPFSSAGIWDRDSLVEQGQLEREQSKNLKAFFNFSFEDPAAELLVKVAISPVSVEGARLNLQNEIPGWDFGAVRDDANKKWNAELAKIDVTGSDSAKLKIFYTALYHTAIVPNIAMDVDGQYRGRDNKIHRADGFTYYSVFSLWDTYRAAHPLYTLIDRARTLDYIKTFLAQYEQGGRLPVWELASCETNCMIGYHSVPVIWDAFQKGIVDFDSVLALEAMKKSATGPRLGLPAYMQKGFIETSDERESVSKTLEYAYDDWCIAQFANAMGNVKDYTLYNDRSQYFKNLFDPSTGFMRPRQNGDWLSSFDPKEVSNHFTEANSWQYSFYFPQDISGYLKLIGGPRKMENKLDALFNASSRMTGRDQSDITGLIGQYAHGNEPSHHIIYLYDYTASPYKTQQLVHKVMEEMYKDDPDGLIGNEDCGQMSAWYVLSALGFYPVTPGNGTYQIGSPLFNLAEIQLENGKSFIINAPGAGGKNYYIQKAFLSTTASLKPKQWDAFYLRHSDIANGGLVTFMMGDKPSKLSPAKFAALDKNLNKETMPIVINPVIHGGNTAFMGSRSLRITCVTPGAKIYYTTDDSEPTAQSKLYKMGFTIDHSATIKAIAITAPGNTSKVTTARFAKLSHQYSIRLNTAFEHEYDGGGPMGLLDGSRGSIDWAKGNWQGYQGNNFEAVIDLKTVQSVKEVSVGFLQDTRSWIIMPKKLLVSTSIDGKTFKQLYSGEEFLPVTDLKVQVKEITASFNIAKARFVKVTAVQYGALPSWHESAGAASHIFVDEISIR